MCLKEQKTTFPLLATMNDKSTTLKYINRSQEFGNSLSVTLKGRAVYTEQAKV